MRREEVVMRKKRNTQNEFDFQPSNLKVTNQYYERYERISEILDGCPEIVDAVHGDLKKLLKRERKNGPGRQCDFSTDTVVRIVICEILEGESLRGTVIRIDDSNFLRRFVRIYNGKMMDFTTLCTLKNAIRPKTWKKINRLLTEAAVEEERISGERCRLDTTVYETNVRWPTDSGLLWDTYRVIARLINTAREIDPEAAADRRLQAKRAKRLHGKIVRRSAKKGTVSRAAKSLYSQLIPLVERLLEWVPTVCERLRAGLAMNAYGFEESFVIDFVIDQLEHFGALGWRVAEQSRRRVLYGESVPNDEKIFSIFEPHTELLKRGKAGKPIEFGHMISIQQVEGKFITDYKVFEKKPVDHALVDGSLESHRRIFGENPREFSADKGFYESMTKIEELEAEIDVVSIGKKGKRTEKETARETSKEFKLGQQFRAGVEGSISFLKRALGMFRCRSKGWEHYVATVGATVFVHNLLVLARG
jgi:IS5 family transposase